MRQTGQESVEVLRDARDAVTGERLEPEEQPVRVTTPIEAPITLGSIPISRLRGVVTKDAPAFEVAAHYSTLCATCANWRRADWRATLAKWSSPGAPADQRARLDRMRGELMLHKRGGSTVDSPAPKGNAALDRDVEDANTILRTDAGICGPLSEILREITITFSVGNCPALLPDGSPVGPMYTPATPGVARAASAAYDAVLRAAQGT